MLGVALFPLLIVSPALIQRKTMSILRVALIVTLLAVTCQAKSFLPTELEARSASSATLDCFGTGNFTATEFNVETSCPASPPKPLLIVRPTENGTYPVLLFLHGTNLLTYFYTDMFQQISSHGYIVVAPQLYEVIPPWEAEELELAAKVASWLLTGLKSLLPENITGDLNQLALAGHSRGGKTAFALALGYAETYVKVNFSALIGVDPVAGFSKEWRTKPEILTYSPGSFNLSIPISIIGTGLGSKPIFPFAIACAPKGVSHEEFFNESRAPAGHFVATDYGHLDMLNDGIIEFVADHLLCKSREGPKDPMRRTVAGITVAFLEAYFRNDASDYKMICYSPDSAAPVTLDVEFHGDLIDNNHDAQVY